MTLLSPVVTWAHPGCFIRQLIQSSFLLCPPRLLPWYSLEKQNLKGLQILISTLKHLTRFQSWINLRHLGKCCVVFKRQRPRRPSPLCRFPPVWPVSLFLDVSRLRPVFWGSHDGVCEGPASASWKNKSWGLLEAHYVLQTDPRALLVSSEATKPPWEVHYNFHSRLTYLTYEARWATVNVLWIEPSSPHG